MDKSGTDVGVFGCTHMQYIVHYTVAYVGSCRERYMAWKSVSTYILNHCFYRNCCKVSGWTVCLKWFIKWLVTCIVRNPGICKVDSYFFYSDAGTSACLTYIDHYIRVMFFDCCFNCRCTFLEFCRNLYIYDLCSRNC